MLLAALLILGFGPLGWTFPWWVWGLGIINGLSVSVGVFTKGD